MNRYRYIRSANGKTLREVAEGAGVSERTLARIENGQEPSPAVAGKLAQFYGITLAELLGVEDPTEAPAEAAA